MLKKVSVILLATLLCACVSQTTDKGFQGAGNFDTAEAAKTRVSLGLTYLKNGNFSQAKFNLDKALEFAPRSGEANFAMAFYYQQVDEVERAHEYYKEAISLSRNDPDILNSYGAFLCKQGDYEQAKKYFLQSVDDKSYISTASTYENLAICSENQGKIEEAIVYFNNALNHQPTRASSLLYISQLYIQTQRWEEAKKSLWKYERNANVTAESLWLSFQIARGQQDLRASVEYADILKRLYPNNLNTIKAISELGKFQPDMTVTQKNRDTTQYIDSNQQKVQLTNTGSKTRRVLAPVVDSDSPKTLIEPIINNDLEEMGNVAIVQNKVDNDTELALKNALDNTEDFPVNAVNITTPKYANDAIGLVEDAIVASEAMHTDNSKEITDIANNTKTPFHIVKPKENLYRISLKYNVKIKKLLEWNNLADESSIEVGAKLWVRDPNSNE